jgi:hypothetical protein
MPVNLVRTPGLKCCQEVFAPTGGGPGLWLAIGYSLTLLERAYRPKSGGRWQR